jgi:hypothetical protein
VAQRVAGALFTEVIGGQVKKTCVSSLPAPKYAIVSNYSAPLPNRFFNLVLGLSRPDLDLKTASLACFEPLLAGVDSEVEPETSNTPLHLPAEIEMSP